MSTKLLKPGSVVVALSALKPQVRGSVLELGKVDSALHPSAGHQTVDQACLGTKHWKLHVRLTT